MAKKTTVNKKNDASKKTTVTPKTSPKKVAVKASPIKKVETKKTTAVPKTKETAVAKTKKTTVNKKSEIKNEITPKKVTKITVVEKPKPKVEKTVRKKIVALPQKIEVKKKPTVKITETKKITPKKEVKTVEKSVTVKPTVGKATVAKPTTVKETTVKKKSKNSAIRYSDADLKEFRAVIQIAKDEQLEELEMLEERIEDFNNRDLAEETTYSLHMGEQGSEAAEKEKTYAMIQRIHEHIKKLNDALNRVDDKTYGICRECHCLIAKERLLAVPITTLSASYKIHQKCPEDGIDKIEKR